MGTHRNIGLFGILELVRDRATFEPMAPFNGSSPEMKAVAQHLRDHGLFAATRWNTIAAIPPLIISEAELAHAYDIIDGALDLLRVRGAAVPIRCIAVRIGRRESRARGW